MVMEGTTIKPFTEFTYKTQDGETITATKKDGVVTLVGDKKGVRQLPLEEFKKEFLATVPKLERTPETDVVNFKGELKTEEQEKTSKNNGGLLLALGALVLAGSAYILTRGKSKVGLEEATKAVEKAAKEIIPETTKVVEKETTKIVEELVPEATKVVEVAAKTTEEVVPKAAKPIETFTKVADEVQQDGEKIAQELFGETPMTKYADDVDDILGETSKRKGAYGQDLDDPFDPLNKDDIMSPYYDSKRRGTMGQDLDDPLDPWNKSDPMSPYYEDPYKSMLETNYDLDGNLGFGSGFGF